MSTKICKNCFAMIISSFMLAYICVVIMFTMQQSSHFLETRDLLESPEEEMPPCVCKESDASEEVEEKRRYPNALIIGAMKCGTGALQKFLALHPDVVTTEVEETEFFNLEYKRGLSWYLKQMPISKPGQITLEKSVYFGNSFRTAERIFNFNKDLKLILIVRDPVDRLVSHFARAKAFAAELRNASLEDAVFHKVSRTIRKTSPYVSRSNYYKHMLNWLYFFPLRQFLILDGDLFKDDPFPQLQRVENFLDIPHRITKDLFYFDHKKGFYCVEVEGKHECLPRGKGRVHPWVKPATLQKLRQFFQPYDQSFSELVGQIFHWQVQNNSSSVPRIVSLRQRDEEM